MKGEQVMATAKSLRLDSDLIITAERIGSIFKRSAPKQIEYWAELGKAVEQVVNIADAMAVLGGTKKITVESVVSKRVDPNNVFNSLEARRESGELAKEVTTATIYYEPSLDHPGLVDKVDSATGKRQAGHFYKDKFIEGS